MLNAQAARASDTIVFTESVLDALSFLHAGIPSAIPLYGTNGLTTDHWDLLTREHVRTVVLALDQDAPGQAATAALSARFLAAGLAVARAHVPGGDQGCERAARVGPGRGTRDLCAVASRRRRRSSRRRPWSPSSRHPRRRPRSPAPVAAGSEDGTLVSLTRDARRYQARVVSRVVGRLRTTVKLTVASAFHVDTIDLYAARSRGEFARRAAKALTLDAAAV